MSLPDFRRLAAAIDARMRQLQVEGADEANRLSSMASFLPDLRQLWRHRSRQQLELLYQAYPRFSAYARLVEDVGHEPPALPQSSVAPGSGDFDRLSAEAEMILTAIRAMPEREKAPGWRRGVADIIQRYKLWLVQFEGLRNQLKALPIERYAATVLAMERLAMPIEAEIRKLSGGRLPFRSRKQTEGPRKASSRL